MAVYISGDAGDIFSALTCVTQKTNIYKLIDGVLFSPGTARTLYWHFYIRCTVLYNIM